MTESRRDPDDLDALRAASDVLSIDALLTDDERAVRDRVRAFVDAEIRPYIADWFDRAHFPAELAPALGRLGVLGMTLDGYGCPGRSAVEYGLAALELEAGDSGIRTFVSVQGSLAMGSIHRWGSDEQKREWLPRLAAGEAIGCFALTEPGAGSDPASMTTHARRDGGDWVITGAKRWIGLASIAQLAVVWARTDDGVRGFLVPTDAPGLEITVLEPKGSMRASVQTQLRFDGVRVPASALLPAARGLRGPFAALNEARYGIVWGALGAARDSYEAALRHALRREPRCGCCCGSRRGGSSSWAAAMPRDASSPDSPTGRRCVSWGAGPAHAPTRSSRRRGIGCWHPAFWPWRSSSACSVRSGCGASRPESHARARTIGRVQRHPVPWEGCPHARLCARSRMTCTTPSCCRETPGSRSSPKEVGQ